LNTTLVPPSGLSRSVLSQVLARILQWDLLSSVAWRCVSTGDWQQGDL